MKPFGFRPWNTICFCFRPTSRFGFHLANNRDLLLNRCWAPMAWGETGYLHTKALLHSSEPVQVDWDPENCFEAGVPILEHLSFLIYR